jgi:hypothetical protein
MKPENRMGSALVNISDMIAKNKEKYGTVRRLEQSKGKEEKLEACLTTDEVNHVQACLAACPGEGQPAAPDNNPCKPNAGDSCGGSLLGLTMPGCVVVAQWPGNRSIFVPETIL